MNSDWFNRNILSLGKKINFPGGSQGNGLSKIAAKELGLKMGTPVGVSLIDAYAGALGLLAYRTPADCSTQERLGKLEFANQLDFPT